MSRKDLQQDASRPGFPVYGPEQLPKTNTMRADKTQPDFMGIPILSDGQVMLCSAEEIGNKPASCYTCTFQNLNETCQLLGPKIQVAKVTGDDTYKQPIEYWPCCSMHNYGKPGAGGYIEPLKTPEALGLIWINAPEPGLEYGGANCSGTNGGDDCDHYQVTKAGDKWDSPSGFCRVLQHEVQGGQVCAAWGDDDILNWRDAQQLLQQGDAPKKKLARDIIGKDQ